ncbi:MAG: DUF2721 domain-containing protein [Verrucomicrobium sp.]|nr:DUF2721 domain-containing protein [Verrucomicrobium sp.]
MLMMDTSLAQNPFSALTFIAAPALLTNASSLLATGTINRLLRTRDRMHELYKRSEQGRLEGEDGARFLAQVGRVEAQGVLLLRSLHAIYIAIASFAGATLVTLLGATLVDFHGAVWFQILTYLGLALGFVGAGSLIVGSACLFRATQLSLMNMQDEAVVIRKRLAS